MTKSRPRQKVGAVTRAINSACHTSHTHRRRHKPLRNRQAPQWQRGCSRAALEPHLAGPNDERRGHRRRTESPTPAAGHWQTTKAAAGPVMMALRSHPIGLTVIAHRHRHQAWHGNRTPHRHQARHGNDMANWIHSPPPPLASLGEQTTFPRPAEILHAQGRWADDCIGFLASLQIPIIRLTSTHRPQTNLINNDPRTGTSRGLVASLLQRRPQLSLPSLSPPSTNLTPTGTTSHLISKPWSSRLKRRKCA